MLTEQILLQIIVIILVSQILSYICHLIGQQWVIGEILTGLVLGPSLLGWLFPDFELYLFPAKALPTFQTLGDIGLQLGVLSPTLFVMLVIMAVLTTVMTSPLITLFNRGSALPVQVPDTYDEILKTDLQL